MIDFGIEMEDYVRLERIPGIVFQVFEIQEKPPSDYYMFGSGNRGKEWKPRARLLYAGGKNKTFGWIHLARWEPLEDLIKLCEMEVIARMAQ